MSIVLFILGRPGSGKSCAYRHIREMARYRGLSICRINDYGVLYEMFKKDIAYRQFKSIHAPAGFYDEVFSVRDYSVLIKALNRINHDALEVLDHRDIIVIEFARDDYHQALQYFDSVLLKRAYFLFIETNLKNCIVRIHNRVETHPLTDDDYYVSPKVLKTYYGKQVFPDLTKIFGISKDRIHIINNDGKQAAFERKVGKFMLTVLSEQKAASIFERILKYVNKWVALLLSILLMTCCAITCFSVKLNSSTTP